MSENPDFGEMLEEVVTETIGDAVSSLGEAIGSLGEGFNSDPVGSELLEPSTQDLDLLRDGGIDIMDDGLLDDGSVTENPYTSFPDDGSVTENPYTSPFDDASESAIPEEGTITGDPEIGDITADPATPGIGDPEALPPEIEAITADPATWGNPWEGASPGEITDIANKMHETKMIL